MYRPRPAPPRRLARQNCRKIRGTSSGATPSPSSRTDTATAAGLGGPGVAAAPSGRIRCPGADGLDRLHHNRHGTSAVPYRVLDEVAEDLVHLVRVQPGLRQVRRGLDPEPVRGVAGRDPPGDDLLGPLRDVHQLAVDLDPARLDPGHVQQLGDQPGHPVSVGVDGLQHDPFLVIGESCPLGQQRRGEAFDAGQRRAQFVGDGGHQVGTAALKTRTLLRSAQGDHNALHGAWVAEPPGRRTRGTGARARSPR